MLDHVDAVAVHGFPLDWNLWQIDEWPAKIDEIEAVTDKPVWVTEVGVSSFGSEEVQVWGVRKTAELLIGPRAAAALVQPLRPAEDLGGDDAAQGGRGLLLLPPLPHGAPARGRHAEAGARGLRRPRAPRWGSASGSTSRTTGSTRRSPGCGGSACGTSAPASPGPTVFREDALDWFDRQMEALADFDVTVTFCFTPEHRGLEPHHTSPPQVAEEFAEFCAAMVRRYCGGEAAAATA